MQVVARRALLAGAGIAMGGSLATLLLPRKPHFPLVEVQPASRHAVAGFDAPAPVVPAVPMPAIAFRDAAGGGHTLAEFAGRGVVLNLWATWCGPCVAEMPSLARLAAAVAGSGIVVLPLSIDAGGAAVVQAFYAAHGIAGLGVWIDPQGQAQAALGVDGVPSTFVVDRRGRKAGLLQGATDWGGAPAAATIRSLVG